MTVILGHAPNNSQTQQCIRQCPVYLVRYSHPTCGRRFGELHPPSITGILLIQAHGTKPVCRQAGQAIKATGLDEHSGIKPGIVGNDPATGKQGADFRVNIVSVWGIGHRFVADPVQLGDDGRNRGGWFNQGVD